MITRRQIPNLLTFARLAAVPISLLVMLIEPHCAPAMLLWIFIAASLTDYLDGYLARKWGVVTPMGALLDPIADKLIVALMLVYILANTPRYHLFLPVIVIILRELYISGLREFLAMRNIALPVSKSGKWKTALQMLAITMILGVIAYGSTKPYTGGHMLLCGFDVCDNASAPLVGLAGMVSVALLYASALLAFTSAASYTRHALRSLRKA